MIFNLDFAYHYAEITTDFDEVKLGALPHFLSSCRVLV